MENKLLILALFLLLVIPIVSAIQVNSSTEIYSFEVLNCTSNTSTIGCPAESVRYSCNITPYAYIDYTYFRLNGTDHTASRSNEIFYYDWNKTTTGVDTDTYMTFERGQIHDIGDGDALFFPNISVHLLCDACNYNITQGPCLINNTRDVEYIGDGMGNCTSYNTTEFCDYCIPDWDVASSCLDNNTEFRQYSDVNSCYNITSLYSDSCSYSFIDCDTWLPCSFLGDDLNCDYDINPLINIAGNKIYWKCNIENGTSSYNCISYVKEQGAIIQSNPQQKIYSIGVVALPQETRQYFSADNGLVQPYFTTENLQSNKTYIFGVQCSNSNGSITAEKYVTPMYRDLDALASRSLWVSQNLGYIFGGVIFIIILIALIVVVRPR